MLPQMAAKFRFQEKSTYPAWDMCFILSLFCFPTTVLTDRFKGSGFNLLNSGESPRIFSFSIFFFFILSLWSKLVNGKANKSLYLWINKNRCILSLGIDIWYVMIHIIIDKAYAVLCIRSAQIYWRNLNENQYHTYENLQTSSLIYSLLFHTD